MPSVAIKRRLARDVSLWQSDGLVSDATGRILAERYATPGFGLVTAVKYLGVVGGILAGFGVMGLVAAAAGSKVFGGLLSLAVAAAFTATGIWLSLDQRARYVHSSKSVLAIGVLALGGAAAVLADAAQLKPAQSVFAAGLVLIPVTAGLAYRFRNTFLLLLALIAFFHWVGSWSGMMGQSTYALEIQDPKLMLGASLAVVAVGVLHERRWKAKTLRFFQAYEVLGLIYVNLSLLILTVEGSHALPWICAWAIASLGQLVAGGWLKNGVFTGFAVTGLAVNLFTRYFERFWDSLSAGTFFLVGGGVLLGFGVLCEWALKRRLAVGAA